MSKILFEIPENWSWTTMGEIADVVGGGTPKTKIPANYEDGTIPWLTPADLSGYTEKLIGKGSRCITETGLSSSSARMMPKGTVLFTSRAPIGYVAIASNEICTNQGFKSFVLRDKEILPEYVYWWLKGNKELAESYASGTTFLELSGTKAKQLPIPIAPFCQQKSIVAEIEKQFSRLDEAVANLKRVKANLKRYKAAVLKAAVEGKLTEEWRRQHPDVEPADKLLERILEERRASWQGRGKYKEPVAPDTSGLPALPEGWVWASFELVADRVTVGHVGPMKNEYVDKGIPFLRSQNVRANRFDPEGLKYVSKEFHKQLSKSALRPGDIVVVRSGSVGVTCVIPDTLAEANCSDLVIIKSPRAVVSAFGAYYMNSVVETRVAAGKVGVALTHFNTQSVAKMPVPLPPLVEQHQIVAEVERRHSIVTEAEAQVDANLRRADRLRQSILKQAFSGQLVSQNPNDEPASMMLERIRANSNDVGATRWVARIPSTKGGRGTASPLRKTPQPAEPVGAIHELPLHAQPVNADFKSLDAVLAAVLNRMEPGREYSRADLFGALGLSTGRWNAAIQELKRRGKVRQLGQRRAAKYTRL